MCNGLLADSVLGNLGENSGVEHTAFTYHRTWETGLGSEIRVTDFSPDFFVPKSAKPESAAPNVEIPQIRHDSPL